MRSIKKVYLGVAGLLVAIGALVALNVTGGTTQAVGDYRSCTNDAIIRCGAITEAELLQKYDANEGDVQNIYKHYGISRSDIAGTTSEVKHGTVYQDGRVVVDGKTVATGAYSLSRVKYTSAGEPRTVKINGTTLYEGPSMAIFVRPVDAYVFFRDGQFYRGIISSCANPLVATPEKPPVPPKPQPKPVYTCDNLTAKKLERARYEFTATATAKNGAEIVNYTFDFGDGKKQTVSGNVVEHPYDKAGTYTITVTVNFRVDGQNKAVSGAKCKTTITVEEKPQEPVYRCESLAAKKIGERKYQFTASATATGGAEVVNYVFDFGDGKKQTTTNTTIEHEYAAAGTYTARLTVNIKANGKTVAATGTRCNTTIKIEEEKKPEVPVYSCDSLTAKKIGRDTYAFTAAATAEKGATVVNHTYDFGDGTKKSSAATEIEHTYAEPGTYTAKLTVHVHVNGKTEQVTSKNCQVTVKVDEKPSEKNPAIEIEKTVNGEDHIKTAVGTEFTYAITVRNKGNVVIKDAVVTDEAPKEVTLVSAVVGTISGSKWTHTIPELGIGASETFFIKAKYAEYASGTHKNTVCVDTPTVPGSPDDCDEATTETEEKIEVCDLNDNTIKTIKRSEFDESHMTTDLSKCGEMEVCIIKDKTIKTIPKNNFDESTMTTDLDECAESPTPPELPRTGIDTLIGGSLGLGSLTAAGYYWAASRKNLLSTLLDK